MYHKPVLLKETIDHLNVLPEGKYVDLTFGGGGHSKMLLSKLGRGTLYAFDSDEEAAANVTEDGNLVFIPHNFRYFRNFLQLHKALPVDGIIADLGISSHQIDDPTRGFSIRFEGRLDMRMNSSLDVSAHTVVNEYSKEELTKIFREYGEISNAWKLATLIIEKRAESVIENTTELLKISSVLAPRGKENQYNARVFQAIRIEVNDEINALKDMLMQLPKVLKPNGRVAVIAYHSLEDRLVKNFFRAGNFTGIIEKDFYGNAIVPLKQITRKPLIPGEEEIKENPRARSARLRIAERIAS